MLKYLLSALTSACFMFAPAASQSEPNHGDFLRMKFGVFIHWTAPPTPQQNSTCFPDGSRSVDINEYADRIDVEKVANSIKDIGFEYVVLTVFHGYGTTFYPSEAIMRWRGAAACSRRDVIRELINAFNARGIRLFLFTHPLDGHDFPKEEAEKLGWNDPTNGYRRWNDFINDVYGEMIDRYGKDIVGIGFDSEFGQIDPIMKGKLNLERLGETFHSRGAKFPHLVTAALPGPWEWVEYGMKEVYDPSWLDPWKTKAEDDFDVEKWPATRRVSCVIAGRHWACIGPASEGKARLTADKYFRYSVLLASSATEGPGICWATSPYTDGSWENGVDQEFHKMKAFIDPIAESIKSVYPSTSYVTQEGMFLSTLPNGIAATRSADSRYEYIHVLNPPKGKTLDLPAPNDGKLFKSGAILRNGHKVILKQDAQGLHLTLPDDHAWEYPDTVIKMKVARESIPKKNLALHQRVLTSSSQELKQYFALSEWSAIRAVDGSRTSVAPASLASWSNPARGWSSTNTPDVNHTEWFMIDLGKPQKISRVDLYPRDDGGNTGYGFPIDFTIQVSADGSDWTTIITKKDYPLPSGTQSFSVSSPKARYIKIEGTNLRRNPNDQGRYRMQLAEVEVYR